MEEIWNSLGSTGHIVVIVLLVIALVVIGFLTMWKKVPQDKAMVITGMRKRVISGGGGFVVPLLERADYISLENIKVEVQVKDALSMLGVGITASGVAVIKVRNDRESILAAVEQFNTGNQQKTIINIKDTGSDVLEGKLREIVSKLTVEEIYRDREKFASKVQEVAAIDLAEMGLEMKVFTIRDISDRNGYLEALGAEKIAQVKKDANIAKAEAQMESDIKTAEAVRLGEAAKIESLTRIEECNKNKELKVQEYKKQSESAKANADLAYQIQENITQKEVIETAMAAKILEKQREKELVDEQMRIEILKKQKEIELAENEVLKKEKELDAGVKKQAEADKFQSEKQSEAEKYREIAQAEAAATSIELEAKAKAEAVRIQGLAEAEIIRAKGAAEIEIVKAKGEAEANVMKEKAQAFRLYNDAAMAQMIVDRMPEIAQAIADKLGVSMKIVDMSFDNLLMSLANDEFDLVIAGLSADEERRKTTDFSDPYLEAKNLILVRAEDADKYASLDDLKGVKGGAQTGSKPYNNCVTYCGEEATVGLAKVQDLVMELEAGKLDVVFLDYMTVLSYADAKEDLAAVDLGIPETSDGYSIAVKKGNTELAEFINGVLAELKEQNAIEQFIVEAKKLESAAE